MADFLPAYERMIANEGGYRLVDVPGDRGGQTYAGISRRSWPNWAGWRTLDAGQTPEASEVRQFYRDNFWSPMRLDEAQSQRIASTLFDFAVNAGPATAAKLAQIIVGTTPDGRIGPRTLTALNSADEDRFGLAYTLAKVARYRDIVLRDRSQAKFLLGWIDRALKEAA